MDSPMAKNDLGDTIAAIVALILGGAIAAAIISALTQAPCPSCGKPVSRNAPQCPNCGRYLYW